MKLIKKDDYTELSTNLKESAIVSNLMDDFPPICKQDPLDVRVNYILDHYEKTGQTIKLSDNPDTMYGGTLPIARNRKSKKRATSEASSTYSTCPSECSCHTVPSIQAEVQDLELAKILNKRTRSGNSVSSSQPPPAQPSVPKKKRKHNIRKMIESPCVENDEDQIEAATTLVAREIRSKKAADAAVLEKVLELAKEIEVPASSIAREDAGVIAQEVIKSVEEVQDWVSTKVRSLIISAGALEEETSGAGELVKATEDVQREEAAISEADASEATRGNTDSLHTANVIEIESSSASPSHSTSISNSSDIDDVPLNIIYTTINKGLSSSTKLQKNPSDETFEPMYPSVLERISEMSQMRLDVCARLPADHPFQPPMIEPLQSLPADAEGVGEPAMSESANLSESSHPKPTTQASEPSVLDDLVNHYSGELPDYEPNLEKASEVASDGVTLESSQ